MCFYVHGLLEKEATQFIFLIIPSPFVIRHGKDFYTLHQIKTGVLVAVI